jgi:hypothetical protein
LRAAAYKNEIKRKAMAIARKTLEELKKALAFDEFMASQIDRQNRKRASREKPINMQRAVRQVREKVNRRMHEQLPD